MKNAQLQIFHFLISSSTLDLTGFFVLKHQAHKYWMKRGIGNTNLISRLPSLTLSKLTDQRNFMDFTIYFMS